jgi:hypothetical protein
LEVALGPHSYQKNLATCKIIDPLVATDCVWCEGEVETSIHLFLHCDFAYRVWMKILGWLGVQFKHPQNLFYHLECWLEAARDKRLRKGFWLFGTPTIWVLWRVRKVRYLMRVDEVVEEIQVLAGNGSYIVLNLHLLVL